MRQNPRLQFTDAELNPKLKEHVRCAEKAADKAEAAREKIPKAKKKVKRATLDPETGKIKARLCFEEVDKVKPPSKLSHTVRDAPGNTVAGAVHREVRLVEEDNVGLESAHRLEETAEVGGRLVQHSYRAQKLKPYREAAKAGYPAAVCRLCPFRSECRRHYGEHRQGREKDGGEVQGYRQFYLAA